MKDAKSEIFSLINYVILKDIPVNKCAASVAIASEFEKIPPTTSPIMKTRHKTEAKINFRLALKSEEIHIVCGIICLFRSLQLVLIQCPYSLKNEVLAD